MGVMTSTWFKWATLGRCLLLLLVTAFIAVRLSHVTGNNLVTTKSETGKEIYKVDKPRVETVKVTKNPALNSPQEDESKRPLKHKKTAEDLTSNNRYAETIASAQRAAIALLDDKKGWRRKSGDSLDGEGLVYTRTVGRDTVFKLEGNIAIDAQTLYEDIVNKPEEASKWSSNVLERGVLERLDNSSDIIYSLSKGSFAASRDLVFARHWELKDGWFIITTVTINYASRPEDPRSLQAKSKTKVITVIRMKETTPKKLRLEWLLHLELKMYIPTMFIQPTLLKGMRTYLKDLRAHAVALLPHP